MGPEGVDGEGKLKSARDLGSRRLRPRSRRRCAPYQDDAPTCHFSISPFSISRDVKANLWTRLDRASNGSSALLNNTALLPLLGYARRGPTLLACIRRLSNSSGIRLHCAFGEASQEISQSAWPMQPSCTVKSRKGLGVLGSPPRRCFMAWYSLWVVFAVRSTKGMQLHCQVAYSRRSPNTRGQTAPVVDCPSPLWLVLGAQQTAVRSRG